jgi:asparagine synthase (glutamine-hydrolysing)
VNGYRSLYKGRETFFEGLEELPAGHVLHVAADGKERLERYWQPKLGVEDGMSYDEAVAGARERLLRSVELRLRADVPLAFCMSGGIDSNSLIGIAKRHFGYDVHGFTIVNTDARYEEQDMVELAVRELGVRHTAIPVQPDNFLPRLRELVRYHDAPVYTISYYAHWMLQESIAAHGYRIAVSGTAADELFTGYYDHHLAYLAEVKDEAPLYERSRRALAGARPPDRAQSAPAEPGPVRRRPGLPQAHLHGRGRFRRLSHRAVGRGVPRGALLRSLLRNRMLNEIFRETIPVILHEDDPQRDVLLGREPLAVPRPESLRVLLLDSPRATWYATARQGGAARRHARLVPQQLLDNRRKVGFNAPISTSSTCATRRCGARCWRTAGVRPGAARAHRGADGEARAANSESLFLFYFLTAKLFLEEFSPQRALA